MSLIVRDEDVALGDDEAVAVLRRALDAQKVAFVKHPFPSRAERQAHLEALAAMMMANRQSIREAMSSDFAVHPALFSDLIECVGIPSRAVYAIGQLDT